MEILPKNWHITLASFVIFLSIWSILTYGGFVESFFLPSPTDVVSATVTLFTEYDLVSDILVSVYRVFAGFLLAAIVGVPLGILIGTHKKIKAFLEPLIGVSRYLPMAAFIPLCILWFGIGDLEKIIFLFIAIAPYLTIMVADISSNVQKELIETAHMFSANNITIITEVIFPASLPGIFDSLRTCAGIGWTCIILAEMIAASSGLGCVIIESQRFLQTANIITAIVVIGLLGLTTDYIFRILRNYLFPWAKVEVA